jgi:hypothetical protein
VFARVAILVDVLFQAICMVHEITLTAEENFLLVGLLELYSSFHTIFEQKIWIENFITAAYIFESWNKLKLRVFVTFAFVLFD